LQEYVTPFNKKNMNEAAQIQILYDALRCGGAGIE